MVRSKRDYTEEEILLAIRLQSGGQDWDSVAERLSRGVESLMTTVSKYKAGKWCPARLRERSARRAEILESGVRRGLTTDEIAAELGLGRSAVQFRLMGLGYDLQARREAALENGHVLRTRKPAIQRTSSQVGSPPP